MLQVKFTLQLEGLSRHNKINKEAVLSSLIEEGVGRSPGGCRSPIPFENRKKDKPIQSVARKPSVKD